MSRYCRLVMWLQAVRLLSAFERRLSLRIEACTEVFQVVDRVETPITKVELFDVLPVGLIRLNICECLHKTLNGHSISISTICASNSSGQGPLRWTFLINVVNGEETPYSWFGTAIVGAG
ncbi:hypothetical protein KCU87_g308, partial [Aureobasidium melanogenum]